MSHLHPFRLLQFLRMLQARKEANNPLSKSKQKYPNHLTRYRERLGFTQQQLAHIIGCRSRETVGRFESGETLPGTMTLLRLSAVVRIPVEFLYQETYLGIREEVRTQEERMPKGIQGILPLPT